MVFLSNQLPSKLNIVVGNNVVFKPKEKGDGMLIQLEITNHFAY